MTFGPIPGLQKTLELREAMFSPEIIWEAVLQFRCSKSERCLPYRVDLICGISKMLLYLKEYLEFSYGQDHEDRQVQVY